MSHIRHVKSHAKQAIISALIIVSSISGITAAYRAPRFRQPSSATQTQTPPIVSVSPDSLDFGDQVVKRISAPRRITVTNTGGKPLYINSATISGDHAKDFTLFKDTCTGATIRVNRSCIIDVKFTPTGTGERNATVVLTDNAADSPQNVSLTGNGINSVDVPPFDVVCLSARVAGITF